MACTGTQVQQACERKPCGDVGNLPKDAGFRECERGAMRLDLNACAPSAAPHARECHPPEFSMHVSREFGVRVSDESACISGMRYACEYIVRVHGMQECLGGRGININGNCLQSYGQSR